MIAGLEHLKSKLDLAKYMQDILIERATDGGGITDNDNLYYSRLREYFLSDPELKSFIPKWIRTIRSIDQFWQFIKREHSTYAERSTFIWSELNGLLEYLESNRSLPSEKNISELLQKFDSDNIHFAWRKALERMDTDPEGAITMARTILESVCKHILDAKGIEYKAAKIEFSELYKLTAKELNLAPDQHAEKVFKQILGGCSAIVNGLGTLRNKLGDAHGKGRSPVKPSVRHAEFAVNLAGTTALFLIQTYKAKENNKVSQSDAT